MTNEPAAKHFSAAAPRYGRLRDRGLLGRLRQQEQRAVHQLAAIRAGETVLDAGCGEGSTLRWLSSRNAKAVGIDLSLAMIRQSSACEAAVAVQDIEALGLRPVFDWVLCLGALEFVDDPRRALANLAECLSPKGRLVLLYPRRGILGALYALYHRSHGIRIHTFGPREADGLLVMSGLRPPYERRRCLLADVVATRPADARAA